MTLTVAAVIKPFIAGPSDTVDLKQKAVDVCAEWNGVHSESRDIVLSPVRMETHAQYETGDHPQNIIDRQLLDLCHFLIAIFGGKLGTPTKTDNSGTLQEIRKFAESEKSEGGKNVLLFFQEDCATDDSLRKFREEMREKCFYGTFKSLDEFGTRLEKQINLVVNRLAPPDKVREVLGNQALLTERQKMELELERVKNQSRIDFERANGQAMASLMLGNVR